MSNDVTVAIVMGSDSDLSTMRQTAQALDEFGVTWEMRVLSAHRTPDDAISYSRALASRGVKVVVAGAGGAAHLPGVLAATTNLPVIGVPIALKNLDGLDSLLSIVQMPKGIPVAAVSVDGARNAGLLAVRILAVSDRSLSSRLDDFVAKMAEEVREKDAKMQEQISSEL
ncbi:MAG: 5-(carboxyamino)imidazole ribonucleotide mutase [Acidimicrobiales bacterium]